MKKLNEWEIVPALMKQLPEGVFLTVEAQGRKNVMTIGWALIGILWKKSVLMVAVRNSRHTYPILEAAGGFAVSVPTQDMRRTLEFCGSQSGRAVDKFKECKLSLRKGQNIDIPVLDIPGYHFECRRIYKNAMDPQIMDKELESLYPKKDYHTLYFGEIVACYQTE